MNEPQISAAHPVRRSCHAPLPPFAGCTGRDVTIAVIDSGVHPDHDHIAADQLGPGVTVFADGTIATGVDASLDRLGHGTAVTAAIQEKAPDALCLPVRVFRESLRTSTAALLAAIRWSIEQDVDVINLSLGTVNEAHRGAFAAAVHEAAEAGIVIVAARQANGAPCYPGALGPVIGVELDWDCPRARYRAGRRDDAHVFHASGYPRPIPGVTPQRNLYGISFAVAQMTGFAALACERLAMEKRQRSRVEPVRNLLRAQISATPRNGA